MPRRPPAWPLRHSARGWWARAPTDCKWQHGAPPRPEAQAPAPALPPAHQRGAGWAGRGLTTGYKGAYPASRHNAYTGRKSPWLKFFTVGPSGGRSTAIHPPRPTGKTSVKRPCASYSARPVRSASRPFAEILVRQVLGSISTSPCLANQRLMPPIPRDIQSPPSAVAKALRNRSRLARINDCLLFKPAYTRRAPSPLLRPP